MIALASLLLLLQAPPEYRVVLGRSAAFHVERPVHRMSVGDSAVASVTILDPREFIVSAKRPGRTNLLLWFGEREVHERILVVEPDLAHVREHLTRVDPGIRLDPTPDGTGFILSGTVPTFQVMNLAVDVVSRLLEGAAPEPGGGLILEDGKEKPEAEPRAAQTRTTPPLRRVQNLLLVRNLPPNLERRLEEAARSMGGGEIQVRRIMRGQVPDDALDAFSLEGSVPSQPALTRVLTLLDKMLGGKESQDNDDFTVIADDGGGLIRGNRFGGGGPGGNAAGGTGGGGGGAGAGIGGSGGRRIRLVNDLQRNIGRALALRTASGRLLSFLRVADLPQVLVGVRILELDRSRLRELGVDWSLALADFRRGFPSSGLSTLPEADNVLQIVNGLTTNRVSIVERKVQLGQTLRLLEAKGLLRTLSEPNLLALSGEISFFRVGGSVPQRTFLATPTGTEGGAEQIEFGIELTMRPVVGEDGTITLDVAPSITTPGPLSPQGDPSFLQTFLNSSLRLRHGEGIVVGGLIAREESENTQQLPLLGDIPVLGALFGRTVKEMRERELAIVILPKIIAPKPASAFSLDLPPPDFPIRAGVFLDPDFGTLPNLPQFRLKNVAEGDEAPR